MRGDGQGRQPEDPSSVDERLGVLPGFPGSADLGGLPLVGGGSTALRRVVRSAVPIALPIAVADASPDAVAGELPDELRRSAERFGVRAVVDLRSDAEARLLPHPLADLPGYRLLPLIDVAAEPQRDVTSEATFGDLYARSLGRNRRTLVEVFRALAAHARAAAAGPGAGAVLVCCAAGRDRTGMVAALLLDLAGAERGAVVDDYHRAGSGSPVVDPPTAPTPHRRGGPDVEAMLDHVHARWGGPADYLRWLGLDDEEVVTLRSLLRPEGAA